jgi:hypothetical protein
MASVVIYKFKGRYTGNPKYEYQAPEAGATHDCILFIAQASEDGLYGPALIETENYGFSDVVFSGHGLLQTDVLKTEQYQGFAGLYEEALQEGSALVYYPTA